MKLSLPKSPALKAAVLLLALILVLQVAVLGYFNLFHLKDHAGFDSSWNYLKSTLIWNEKTLSGTGLWADTSNAQLDTPTLPAALLYGITGNIWLSYGICNLILLLLILWTTWSLLTKLNLGLCAKLAALNLLVCPYLSADFSVINDLSYLGNMLAGASYYSVRALLALLVFNELLRFRREDRFRPLCIVPVLLCLLAGVSSGAFMLIVLLAPCLLYEILVAFVKADWKQLIRKESLFLYLCGAVLILGRLLGKHVLGIVIEDTTRTWTTLERLWVNIGAVFQGFLKLLGTLSATDTNVQIVSAGGFPVLFSLFLVLLFVLGVGSAIRRIRKDLLAEDGVPFFLLTVLGSTILIFSLFNVQYGSSIFEERYLIVAFLALVIMAALLVDRLESGTPFSAFILAGLILSLAVVNVQSDRTYLKTTNDSWQMDEIVEIAEQKNTRLVYCWGNDVYTVGLTLRVYDMDRIYKDMYENGVFRHWGSYLYLENHEDYSGPTLLLVANSQAEDLPDDVLDNYDFVQTLDNITVYSSDHNPLGQ